MWSFIRHMLFVFFFYCFFIEVSPNVQNVQTNIIFKICISFNLNVCENELKILVGKFRFNLQPIQNIQNTSWESCLIRFACHVDDGCSTRCVVSVSEHCKAFGSLLIAVRQRRQRAAIFHLRYVFLGARKPHINKNKQSHTHIHIFTHTQHPTANPQHIRKSFICILPLTQRRLSLPIPTIPIPTQLYTMPNICFSF